MSLNQPANADDVANAMVKPTGSLSDPAVVSPDPADAAPASAGAARVDPRDGHALVASQKWVLAVAVLAAVALLSTGLLWQKLNNIQEELARRSLDSGAQAIEARTLAKAAQDSAVELTARLALQETRISEVSLQRTQLEELMQSLSRSRDENLVVDIESAIRLAQQQAQLTGSAEPLMAALRAADQRLSRAAQPRLNPLQRAMAKDAERIKAASLTDVPVLMMKIDELTRLADDMPVANAFAAGGGARSAASSRLQSDVPRQAASGSVSSPAAVQTMTAFDWFDTDRLLGVAKGAVASVVGELRGLLRVSRIDQPEAALLSPEQAFFLRENFKLRLLNARLGLLSRQTDLARTDLGNAALWLNKYFDASSRKTQAAQDLLQQVQSQLKTSELPRLDDTMAALNTAAAGR